MLFLDFFFLSLFLKINIRCTRRERMSPWKEEAEASQRTGSAPGPQAAPCGNYGLSSALQLETSGLFALERP